MQMRGDGRRLAHRRNEILAQVVDLDRGEAETCETRRPTGGSDELGEVETRFPIAIAAEIDPGQDDFTVSLLDPALNLGEHRARRAATGSSAHLRDDAEPAREAAAVLNLDESPYPVEPDARPDAADGSDVASDELRRPLTCHRNNRHVRGEPVEGSREPRAAARHVDAGRPPGSAPRRLARLPHGFVSHTAGVDHSDVDGFLRLQVALRREALAQLLRIGVRHLAAEEIDAETRHDARMLADLGGYAGGASRRVRSA